MNEALTNILYWSLVSGRLALIGTTFIVTSLATISLDL